MIKDAVATGCCGGELLKVAGNGFAAGFEPANADTKNRCPPWPQSKRNIRLPEPSKGARLAGRLCALTVSID